MPITKSNCYENEEPDPFSKIPDAGVKCQLAIMDDILHKVALRRVFRALNDNSTLHCIAGAFGKNEVRVCIDVVLEGEEETLLAVPTVEFETLGEALGSFVSWPKDLVTFGDPKVNISKKKKKEREMLTDEESAKSKTKESPVGSNASLKISAVDECSMNIKLLLQVVSVMDDTRPTSIDLDKDVTGYQQTIYLIIFFASLS